MIADFPDPEWPATITRFRLFMSSSTFLHASVDINRSLSCCHCSNMILSTADSVRNKSLNYMAYCMQIYA